MRSARVALPLALVLFAALCVGVLLLDQFATSGPKTADDTAVKSSPNASQMAKPSASDGVTERSVSTGSTDGDVISTVETGARSPRIPWPLPDDHSEAVEQIRKEELELIGLPEELSIGGSNEDVYPVSTVRDAATGESILDAQVLATFFYGTEDSLSAGHPPLAQQQIPLEPDGSLRVPNYRPSDPRVRVHLQVEHPDYAPSVYVLKRVELFPLRWERKEIALRRALTVPVRIVAPDRRPLPRLPLLVTPKRDTHALMEKPVVEIASHATGRYATPAQTVVRYTDERGFLALPYSHYSYSLASLHSLLTLFLRDPITKIETFGVVSYRLPRFTAGREQHVIAIPLGVQRFFLHDKNSEPIVDAEVEVQMGSGSLPYRTRTDGEGQLLIGVPSQAKIWEPEEARITVLTPDYHKRGMTVEVPSAESRIYLPARPAPRLRLRTVAGDPVRAVTPVGAELFRSSTLIYAADDGVLEYSGALQGEPRVTDLLVRGYVPMNLNLPGPPTDAVTQTGMSTVDLGDVVLDRGFRRKIILDGVERSSLRDAVLSLSPVDRPELVSRYPLHGKATLELSGLQLAQYDVTVVGPYLDDFSTLFEMELTLEEKPLRLSVSDTDIETIQVIGRLVDGTAEDFALAQVIERFQVAGETLPRVMEPYPVSPDGSFGSTRRLFGVETVHVSIVTPDDKAVELMIPRRDGSRVFEAGTPRLMKRPHAEVSFFVDGLGRVPPPEHLTIEGQDEFGSLARFRLSNRRLYIDNLSDGLYQLRWRVTESAEESIGFEVKGALTKLRAVRSPLPKEVIEVRIVDRDGQPIMHARIVDGDWPRTLHGHKGSSSQTELEIGSTFDLAAQHVELDSGVQLVEIRPREANRFTVQADGYLDVHIDVAAGEVVPTEIVLCVPAAAEGIVLDADGLVVTDGELLVEWAPLTPQPIKYGEPVSAHVQDGEFRFGGLPSVLRRFTFRLADSAVSVTRTLTLAETDEVFDLGTLWMRETRSLRGVVLLPDGSRAAGATVAIVEQHEVERFPLRDPVDFTTARYRTETDEQGTFLLDNLPVDLAVDLVLLARLEGYSDAYITPIDLNAESPNLQLGLAAELALDVGYADGVEREDYKFTLEYQSDPDDLRTRTVLGEIPAQLFGLHRFVGIEPGLYRVRWSLRETYEAIPALVEEVIAAPGMVTELRLLLGGRVLAGEASLNGRPVERGWIVLTDRPGETGGSRAARVIDGQFVIVDPPISPSTLGAVIPEDEPQPQQNTVRGEALPVRIRSYALALRQGFLSFDYTGYKLRLKFTPEFLSRYPGATLSFSHFEWDGREFDAFRDSEIIETPFVDFHLYHPGIHRFTVRSARGSLLLTRPVALGRNDETVLLK